MFHAFFMHVLSTIQARGVPLTARVAERAHTLQGSRRGAGEPYEHPQVAQTGGQRPQHIRDDPENTDTTGMSALHTGASLRPL